MTIKTKSSFYYINGIDSSNLYMNFIEPNQLNIELTATLRLGSYSMSELALEVERTLNDTGENNYTVSFNRATRFITISADDDFNLLVTTGANSGLSVYSLIGFTVNKSGASSYVSDLAIGTSYRPQFYLQNYVDALNNADGIQASVNESASGVVEVVTFGSRSFYEFNIKWITDRVRIADAFMENNQNALQEARDFMAFAITKQKMEFMKDRADVNSYDIVLLESTRASRFGTSYELNEMSSLDEYYETGKLVFRKVV